jgi:YcaO-like protein with predicted kinase domain
MRAAARTLASACGPRGGFSSPYLDRIRPAAETIAALRPKLPELGITRLARLTGLDVVGIPVWSAIRPNARTLAVSQGKGIDDDAAAASAMMEAIEGATAERADLPHVTLSQKDMAALDRRVALLDDLLRTGNEPPDDDEVIAWIEGFDLMSGAAVCVPMEAAALSDQRVPSRYWQSTDGLASGNVLWEAIFHGLCERIERDALTLWRFQDETGIASRCRQPGAFDDPEVRKLADRIEGAGLRLQLFDITSDVGVPVFFATISPPPSGDAARWRRFDLVSGSGCHPVPARAVIRAVTEAAQSRLTAISGARDDIDPSDYRARLNNDLIPYLTVAPATARVDEPAIAPAPSTYLDFMIGRVKAVGGRSIIVVPLENGDRGYAVAKVFVSDLETVPGRRRFPHGRRALRAMLARR